MIGARMSSARFGKEEESTIGPGPTAQSNEPFLVDGFGMPRVNHLRLGGRMVVICPIV